MFPFPAVILGTYGNMFYLWFCIFLFRWRMLLNSSQIARELCCVNWRVIQMIWRFAGRQDIIRLNLVSKAVDCSKCVFFVLLSLSQNNVAFIRHVYWNDTACIVSRVGHCCSLPGVGEGGRGPGVGDSRSYGDIHTNISLSNSWAHLSHI